MERRDSNSRPSALTLRAPAKVNLTLRIHARLHNGYHVLSSVVTPTSLADIVRLSCDSFGPRTISVRYGAELEAHHAAVSEQLPEMTHALRDLETSSNLAFKAAELFFHVTGREQAGFSIEIEKNIPLGAGLGGGSSDAAATLRGLNELCARPCSEKQLAVMAAEIGADVPALLAGRPGVMTGIGEQFYPLPEIPPALRVPIYPVLLKPLASVNTAWAYERLGFEKRFTPSEAREQLLKDLQNDLHLRALGVRFAPTGESDKWLTLLPQEGISDTPVSGSRERIYAHFVNDFQGLVFGQVPEIAQADERLRESGAEHVLLAGSGSSLVGFFPNGEQREVAVRSLKARGRRGWLITPIELELSRAD